MKRTIILPRQCGKAEVLVNEIIHRQSLKSLPPMRPGAIHAIDRRDVEKGNHRVLSSRNVLGQSPEDIRRCEGSLFISLLGYEHDKKELYLIPEVRDFYFKATKSDPHWLYSSHTTFPTLVVIALCCLQNLLVRPRENCVEVSFETGDMLNFAYACMGSLHKLMSRIGAADRGEARLAEALRALGL
jgi:hypothetical protein